MQQIKLKAKEERRLKAGHWWVFSNEIDGLDTSIEPGTLVRVMSSEGVQVGIGTFNPHSLIAVRLLQKGEDDLPKDFIFEKLDEAYSRRKEIGVRKYGRMCYGEGDNLPGLVIDRYGDVLVVDVLTAGMELLKPQITKALQKIFKPTGIYYKNDSAFRALEGLTNTPEIIGEVPETVEIEENGVKYIVPIRGGQKTGFYFDQRENRAFLKPYFKDKLVLDLYSYIGSFGITAAKAGAAQVWGCDSSAAAVELAKKNVELNGVSDIAVFHRDDAERLLSAMKKGELPDQPDIVLLDPPAFVKSRKALPQAVGLYVKLVKMALEGLKPGGYLAFSTCSHHVSRELFVDIIRQGVSKSGVQAALIELRGQAKDHPVLIGMPETEYLHFALVQVR
ncbi:class I SAM-dependent rRNA methyltransferase [Candidatus Avelusimicrobium luingense]|uniref:class I SAM-dependent rRNA methyltransferase n=1 Tax=Candidatus Avelusimicrobium luingense TaxID=3416211 RepID=UPI003D0B59B4